jgi:peptidoglycan/xylan/chitin deacetylase (PgdA/CDA1 family)
MKTGGRLLFFWDYDTQWGADRSRAAGGPKSWGHLDFENTERLLDLHEEYDVKACFAVVGAAALPGTRPYSDQAQIRRIHAAGHEVASHAFRHEWLPGLDDRALRETLQRSKDILEQCIGSSVTSFVPPFNQPFDYPAGWSFSLSERTAVRRERTGLKRLCETLKDCGYSFCRVCYRSLARRLSDGLTGRRLRSPVRPELIGGLTCLRLNAPAGFGEPTIRLVRRCAAEGGFAVVYGHPHSLFSGNFQDERHLIPFLQLVRKLREEGRLEVGLPRDLSFEHCEAESVKHAGVHVAKDEVII